MNSIPLIGTIACGEPILAEENIEAMVDIPAHIRADFALRCKGNSMINARIFDGDIVYIRQQPTVDNGQIAAVLINDEATLKRVRLFPDHIVLEPENPQFRPLVYWENEMNSVRILGLAVAFTSMVR
jgi:repressor LexA